jgi:hypothetical protein
MTAPAQLPLPIRFITVRGPMPRPPWSKLVPLRTAAGLAGNVLDNAPNTPGVYVIFRDDKGGRTFISRGYAGNRGLRRRLGDHATCAHRMCGSAVPYHAQWLVTRSEVEAKAWEKAIYLGSGDQKELEMAQEAAEFLYELASELASMGGADPFSRPALR